MEKAIMHRGRGRQEISVPAFQFCCEPKIALKIKIYFEIFVNWLVTIVL